MTTSTRLGDSTPEVSLKLSSLPSPQHPPQGRPITRKSAAPFRDSWKAHALYVLGVVILGAVWIHLAGQVGGHLSNPGGRIGDVAVELFGMFALALSAMIAIIVTSRAGR